MTGTRNGCDPEAVEDLARERLPADAAAALEAHLRRCSACTQELAWLRAERALLRRPPEPPPPPAIWQAVERRIAERRRFLPGRGTLVGASVALAAAAALALVLHPPVGPAPVAVTARDPDRALDTAEQEYRQAIAALETALATAQEHGSRLSSRWRTDLAVARTEVADARGAAGRDPDARLRVLDGYAAYLRSLQAVVLAVEEQRP